MRDDYKGKLSLGYPTSSGLSDVAFTSTPYSGSGDMKKKTGTATSANLAHDQMSGNWSGWDGLHRVIDSATLSDIA